MYYYVFDEFVQSPKFEKELAQIETRLTDLGINGKIARLALFRDATEFIRDELKQGVKTVVAVGNDITLRKCIDAVGDANIAVGIIPMGKENNAIARLLGVPIGLPACDVLSARILEEVDIGVVNGLRFMHSVHADKTRPFTADCGSYTMGTLYNGSFELRNLMFPDKDLPPSDPTDGRLELVVQLQKRSLFFSHPTGPTFVPLKSARFSFSQEETFTIDGQEYKTNMLDMRVIPGALKFVTSKSRVF